jgi:chromosomal replication initiation ATPase DnaA
MNFKNHPLGMPQTYAEKLVQRHSDLGFIMAQLNREYGQHGLTRDDIAKLRKPKNEPFEAKMTAHVTDKYIRQTDFEAFRATITADAKLLQKLNEARGIVTEPIKITKLRKVSYIAPTPDRIPEGPRGIIGSIAQDMDVKASDIVGLGRVKPVMQARLVAYKVLSMRGASLTQVGQWIGGRDHSTVINGLRKFEKDATPSMRELVRRWTEREDGQQD